MRTLALLLGLIFTLPAITLGLEAPKLILNHSTRLETWDNVYLVRSTSSSARGTTYTRHLTSLGTTWEPFSFLELGVRGANEFRFYTAPSTTPFSRDEIVFDNLYLRLNAKMGWPVSLTVGRQDMKFGEGWLVADGTPLDGTRTTYFNAVRFDVRPERQTVVTGFYVYSDREDRGLPIFKNNHRQLTEQAYEGGGLWIRRDWTDYDLNVYYLQKNDRTRKYVIGGYYAPHQKTNAFGVRGEYLYNGNLRFTAEGALQQGFFTDASNHARMQEEYRQAYGFMLHLRRDLPSRWWLPKYIELGEIMMSGDFPGTQNKYEGWDPMWGRTPIWSESYVYTLDNESGYAYWSNFRSLYAEICVPVTEQARFTVDYRYMWALTFDTNEHWSGDRGIMWLGKLDYCINKRLSGRCIWERIEPDNFHDDMLYIPRRTPAPYTWISLEVSYHY